jgi:hypothetical protein
MNLFECEVCGNKDPQNLDELVEHILSIHPDYTELEAEQYANLWIDNKLEEQEAEIYEPENPADRDPL